MHYETFEPSQSLQDFVKCYWTLVSPKEENPLKQTIVPDGCMEMIFHFGDAYYQYINGEKKIIQPKYFVFGQLTAPLEIQPTGATGIFSVRFHPGGFYPFSTMPIKDLENKAVSLAVLFGQEGEQLSHDIVHTKDTSEKIALIEDFLLKRLLLSETIDKIIHSTVDMIVTGNGQLTIEDISSRNHINRRMLERKFAANIGLSPKQLSKIIRLQYTLTKILNKEFTNLTDIAYQGDYYDQAHFIKDFKEFTGHTPKEFYSDNLAMTTLFYGME